MALPNVNSQTREPTTHIVSRVLCAVTQGLLASEFDGFLKRGFSHRWPPALSRFRERQGIDRGKAARLPRRRRESEGIVPVRTVDGGSAQLVHHHRQELSATSPNSRPEIIGPQNKFDHIGSTTRRCQDQATDRTRHRPCHLLVRQILAAVENGDRLWRFG